MNIIKKAYRVKTEYDFQKVFHQGKSTANRQLVLYYLEKDEQDHFRVGLSVGKKMGNAVKRNQIKRYLRQAILELKPYIRPDIDFLLIARPDIKEKDFGQVKNSVSHVLKLGKILKENNAGGLKVED